MSSATKPCFFCPRPPNRFGSPPGAESTQCMTPAVVALDRHPGRSAISSQRKENVPADQRIDMRIGVHIGDIIIEEGDIFGDGVNVAARLEGIAQPGGISISEDAWRQVQGKVAANFVDTGEQRLKNIPRPVRVYCLKLDGEGATGPAAAPLPSPEQPSIAVLP